MKNKNILKELENIRTWIFYNCERVGDKKILKMLYAVDEVMDIISSK